MCNYLLVIYIGIYPVLSINGRYMDYPVASGNLRIAGAGLAVLDTVMWQPKGTLLTSIHINFGSSTFSVDG
jgi:hypothetical protein